MSNTIIPITSHSFSVHVNQSFSITLSEISCPNCYWIVDHAPQIKLHASTEHATNSSNNHQWVFEATYPGTYTIELYFKKRCCGKPTLMHETYTLVVH